MTNQQNPNPKKEERKPGQQQGGGGQKSGQQQQTQNKPGQQGHGHEPNRKPEPHQP